MNAKLIVDIPAINWACTYPLDQEKVQSAGRGKHNAIEVPELGTSDRHAEFYFSRGNWYVRDVGGEGGLRVNGKIVQERPLANGDDIRIGNSQLLFCLEEEAVEKEEWKRASEIVRSESIRVRDSLGGDKANAAVAKKDNGQATEQPNREPVTPAALPTRPKMLPALQKTQSEDAAPPEDADDLVWVSRQMASLLEEVLLKPASLEFVFQRMLMRLRAAVDADYGFLMIQNSKTGRWVIRNQVGDAFSWSGYERAHPVPLTAATIAFKRKRAISNAMADDDRVEDVGPSASMVALRVNGYIAVPLLKGDDCRGVLYFDTRNGEKEFRARHVKLLEQAGATMVEIESRKQEAARQN
ncbi:MAG: FHA domain-containing protein [Candidatus Sumerlaeaceae bacterium]